ncbi:unnamed protein product [Periconia digitata]|uniref:Uncharacterized protein n=1 Tax=Periconia digitata TaxID=1303443 RepID=A0A9W4XP93_9PLEO|nr:unnamed protein product [Periconia digitata]
MSRRFQVADFNRKDSPEYLRNHFMFKPPLLADECLHGSRNDWLALRMRIAAYLR